MTEQVVANPEKFVDLHTQVSLQEIQVREGVVLRPMQEGDATALLDILASDPSIRDRVAVAAKLHSEEDIALEVSESEQDPGLIRYMIVDESAVVGLVSFWRDEGYFGQPARPDAYGFGYFLSPSSRGRGLVGGSVHAIMAAAEKVLSVESYMAFCESDNQESIAVLEKLEFKPNGISYEVPGHGWQECMYERGPLHEQ